MSGDQSEVYQRECLDVNSQNFSEIIKKRIHIVGEGPGPKPRARNREETLLSGYMRKRGCILCLFNRADANMSIYKNRNTNSQNFGNTCEAPGTAVNSFRTDLI